MRALLLHKEPVFNASVADIAAPDLSAGEVRVGVDYSTLNYKDGLAITNAAPVVRLWPMVAGIDGSGTVLESKHPDWKAGDAFVLNGWGVGETHWGCLAEQACLKGDWLVRRPAAFSARQAMAIGTAGYTAPEVHAPGIYSFPADVFSFAVVAWETTCETLQPNPLSGMDLVQASDMVILMIHDLHYYA